MLQLRISNRSLTIDVSHITDCVRRIVSLRPSVCELFCLQRRKNESGCRVWIRPTRRSNYRHVACGCSTTVAGERTSPMRAVAHLRPSKVSFNLWSCVSEIGAWATRCSMSAPVTVRAFAARPHCPRHRPPHTRECPHPRSRAQGQTLFWSSKVSPRQILFWSFKVSPLRIASQSPQSAAGAQTLF